jgi:molybdopterin-guanine dinucleotide biosynthesis protein A
VTGVSAVILAGGRSSRFGRDKLAVPIDGRPLLRHAIDAVRPLATEILVVVAPGVAPAVPDDVRLVHDPVAFEGPLAGARAGLMAASESTVILVGGDMPDLLDAVLRLMAARVADTDADAVILEGDGRPHPLPMALRRDAGLLAAQRLLDHGERRLRALADALAAHVVPEPDWRSLDPDGRTLRDIDTEADLT